MTEVGGVGGGGATEIFQWIAWPGMVKGDIRRAVLPSIVDRDIRPTSHLVYIVVVA